MPLYFLFYMPHMHQRVGDIMKSMISRCELQKGTAYWSVCACTESKTCSKPKAVLSVHICQKVFIPVLATLHNKYQVRDEKYIFGKIKFKNSIKMEFIMPSNGGHREYASHLPYGFYLASVSKFGRVSRLPYNVNWRKRLP